MAVGRKQRRGGGGEVGAHQPVVMAHSEQGTESGERGWGRDGCEMRNGKHCASEKK